LSLCFIALKAITESRVPDARQGHKCLAQPPSHNK
jgi:hypothetical protein